MEILLSLQQLQKSFGPKVLFNDLSFTVHQRDRIGMVGKNGSGKSTLLKILCHEEPASGGKIAKKTGMTLSYVPQEETFTAQTIREILLSFKPMSLDDFEFDRRVDHCLLACGFPDPDQKASSLSGGYQKRLSFAKAWIQQPDCMLLDEPTNHLDLDTLFWLENTLQTLQCALIIVSHDRYFLQNCCNKIIELSPHYPKGCLVVDGDYQEFVKRKELIIASNIEREHRLKAQVKKEVDWMNTSPKARTTKSTARIKDAEALQTTFEDLKKKNNPLTLSLSIESSERETNKLIAIKNLSKKMGQKVLFKGLDLMITPKTRLGVLGFNGSGKTTLLKIIAKEIQPDMGTLKYADDCKIVYFKQHREIFEKAETLKTVLCPHSDYVVFQGQPCHINGFCKLLGFEPSDLDRPCHRFSGGEKARALIGKLMLETADVLLLDEPTNDLDSETLDTFLNVLADYQGAIIIISHDRFFLDALCDQMIGLGIEEECQFFSNFQGFQQAINLKKEQMKRPLAVTHPIKRNLQEEKKRLKVVMNKITVLETSLAEKERILSQTVDTPTVNELCSQIAALHEQLNPLLAEWEKLEEQLMNDS